MLVIGVLLWMIVSLTLWKLCGWIRVWVMVNRIPGPRAFWILGNAFSIITTRFEDLDWMVKRMVRRFPNTPVIRFWVFYCPFILIKSASAAEVILKNSREVEKNIMYDVLRGWLGGGLITSHSKKWAIDRKLVVRSLHFQVLNSFVEIFNDKSLTLLDRLRPHVDGDCIEIENYLTLCTLDIICEAAMGKDINAQKERESEYVKAIANWSRVICRRICHPWLTIDLLYHFTRLKKKEGACLKILHEFGNKVIQERKQNREDVSKRDRCEDKNPKIRLMDMLLDLAEKRKPSDHDQWIHEHVDTLMFAGHDTTATSLSWVLYFLGCHPNVQHKLHQEIDEVFMDDRSRAVTSDDLSKLKYMEAVIKESIRMVPIVPIFGRCLKKDTQIEGYTIPAGVNVVVLPYFIQHDPKLFDRPHVFDPDRFYLKEKPIHPYGFLGFSAGPRSCIGQRFSIMEEKVILSHLMRNFRVSSRSRLEDIKISLSVIAKPLNGIYINLHGR